MLHSNVVEPKTKCCTLMCVNQMIHSNLVPPIHIKDSKYCYLDAFLNGDSFKSRKYENAEMAGSGLTVQL